MPEINTSDWDRFLIQFPDAHLLQTSLWGEFKAAFGWSATRVTTHPNQEGRACGAQILFRHLPLGFSFAYIPKGPVGDPSETDQKALWSEIDRVCKRARAIALKVEPDLFSDVIRDPDIDLCLPQLCPVSASPPPNFRHGSHAIQPVRTLVVSLNGDEDDVLARMKQKTRYNIRLALKKGVVVRPSADIEKFYRLLQITGGRDQFGVHSLDYYRQAYETFHPYGACELLMAEYQGEPLAGLMIFASGKRAWYLYGASTNNHRDRMPNYLLQWEAMRWARSRGCQEYDLWGVPDFDLEILENNFTSRSDGLWGVYRFKRGFGGALCRSAGPWDRVYNPPLYQMYNLWANRG